jgi:UDP-N-acetylmuramoylalanine--D-glutamate ligase
MDSRAYFQGKKVTVMRIGLLGRGVGDAAFLAEQGAEVMVVDDAPQEQMQPSVDALSRYQNVRFTFGPYNPEDFVHADFVLKGAGAKQEEPALMAARAAGVPIKMSASWFAEISRIPVVGVTGTRGKTTVTHMIYDIMRLAGMEVLLGGNIRGVSTLALLPQVTQNSIALMELDSWQCQGWGESKLSPNVAVFTTFMPDHMNYYKNDMQAYLFDKAQIFINQKPSDTLVVSDQVLPQLDQFKHAVQSHVSIARAGNIELSVLGEHNQLNAACALEAARALGIDDDVSFVALKNFQGVEGRLQFVREVRGVKIYNDNNSTTPDATVAALRAVGDVALKKVVLILGGDDKKLDMSALIAEIPLWCSKVVLFKERGTERIRDAVFALKEHGVQVYEEDGLAATVERAFSVAVPGETLLYSPAFSSFGKYFKNEYDRGDQFATLIKVL